MMILGLTGSIGMGKTTASAMFRDLGVPVHDADAAVHALFARGGAAVAPLGAAFEGVVVDGAVDRVRLSQCVVGDDAAFKLLESITHPLVGQVSRNFLRRCGMAGAPVVVMDVPLLLETNGDRRCDAVVVVSAPAFLQRKRVLARPGMTPEKFADILARQMPDAAKRARANVVVPSGLGKALTLARIKTIVAWARCQSGLNWPPVPRTSTFSARARRQSILPVISSAPLRRDPHA